MRFEAANLKDSFRKWRLCLLIAVIGVAAFAIFYLSVEIPNYVKMAQDPIFGGYFPNAKADALLKNLIQVFSAAVSFALVSLPVLHFLAKGKKAAEQYGLVVEESTLNILCKGKHVTVDILSVDRFEIYPMQHGQTLKFKMDGAFIEANGETYELLYLKDLPSAKNVFESNKKRLSS